MGRRRYLTQMNPKDRGFWCVGRTTTGKRCKNIPPKNHHRCHLHTSQKKYLRHNIVTLSDRDFNNLSKKVKTENRRRIAAKKSKWASVGLNRKASKWDYQGNDTSKCTISRSGNHVPITNQRVKYTSCKWCGFYIQKL